MNRPFVYCLLFLLLIPFSVKAQTDKTVQLRMDEVKAQLQDFDTEHLLDSLDQEKLPKLVSGGVFGGGNVSNFIITRNHQPMSSYMRIGAEIGGFLDFAVSKHFAVQPQVILTAHQNYFAATDTTNRLWSFGMDIPIYFLGRFGNLERGFGINLLEGTKKRPIQENDAFLLSDKVIRNDYFKH